MLFFHYGHFITKNTEEIINLIDNKAKVISIALQFKKLLNKSVKLNCK